MNPQVPDHDRTVELLAATLADEAAAVETTPGSLQEIQRRTSMRTGRRGRWVWPAAGAGLATAAAIAGAIAVTGSDSTPSPVDPAAGQTSVQLTYWSRPVGGDVDYPPANQPRLHTETHVVMSTGAGQDTQAVHEFLTSEPFDDDYHSGWPDGVDVEGVTKSGDGLTTIALQGDADLAAAGTVSADEAVPAIQAMLRTAGVDEAAVITYNGEPVTALLGVQLTAPLKVLPDDLYRAWIDVDGVTDGETLRNPVAIDVTANTFEGTVNWRLLDESGTTVDEGFVTTSMGAWSSATADLGTLAPGTYVFKAYEVSAADGDEINADTKTFTVAE